MVLVGDIPLFVKTTGKVIRVGNPTGTTAKGLLRSARPSQAAVSGTIAFNLAHSFDKKKGVLILVIALSAYKKAALLFRITIFFW